MCRINVIRHHCHAPLHQVRHSGRETLGPSPTPIQPNPHLHIRGIPHLNLLVHQPTPNKTPTHLTIQEGGQPKPQRPPAPAASQPDSVATTCLPCPCPRPSRVRSSAGRRSSESTCESSSSALRACSGSWPRCVPRYVILGCAHFVRCCGLENEGNPYALAALGFAVVPHRLAGVPWGSPVCRGGGLKCALAVVRAATVGFAKKCLSGSAPPEETRTF